MQKFKISCSKTSKLVLNQMWLENIKTAIYLRLFTFVVK